MSLTRDKQAMLVKKGHTLIEAHCKAKTTCYAGSAQIRRIRKKMVEVMQREASKSMMRELVKKLIPEALGTEIEKVTRGIFPIQNCLIRKVKMLKKPKFDLTKLMELHTESYQDVGTEMIRDEDEAAQNTLTAEIEADD